MKSIRALLLLLLAVSAGCDPMHLVPNRDYVACRSDLQSSGCMKYCGEYPRDIVCACQIDPQSADCRAYCDEHGSDAICRDAGATPDGSDGSDAGPDGSVDLCEDSTECADPGAPTCTAGRCSACVQDADCARFEATSVCGAEGACVACSSASDDACRAEGQVCDVGSSVCVACNVASDCTDALAPVCEEHVCRGCRDDGECAAGGQVCLEDTGACVACEPNKDDPTRENCANGNACDPATFTCTGAPRNSLSTCASCVSDSECLAGTRCVSTNFAGTTHGNYCLLGAPEEPTLCPNQYAARRSGSSVLGVTGEYCYPNDAFTTCEAILDFKNACMGMDERCGADNLTDGICRSGRCTYGCDGASDCSGSTDTVNKCIGVAGAKYCDPN